MDRNHFARVAVVACAALALVGCAGFEMPSKKIDYKSAGKIPPLDVPPDLTRPTADDRYLVPDVNPRGTATFSAYSKDRSGVSPTAAARDVLPEAGDARIERAGTQRWLVVKSEPAALWPVVKDFWQETGFIVNVEIPEAGVMETDWAENRAKIPDGFIRNTLGKLLDAVYSTSERDKFRTRLERGGETGTTEIYISHRGMEEVYTGDGVDNKDTRWQPRLPNPELEAEMLRRLMVRLGVQENRAKAQLASQQRHAACVVVAQCRWRDAFARRAVRSRLAAGRSRARSRGLHRGGSGSLEGPLLRALHRSRNRQQERPTKAGSRGLKFWGGTSKPKNEQYQILVQGGDNSAQVNVLDKSGARENSQTAGRILSLLYEQLK